MRERTTKVYYLDGIRGIAALVVLLHHFCLAFLPASYTLKATDAHLRNQWEVVFGNTVASVILNGNFAVCVFFVLSGYVLSRQFFLSGKVETIVSAASRRFIRLYVPVAVTLAIAYCMLRGGLFFNVAASRLAHSEWWMGSFWVTLFPEQQLFSSLTYSTMFLGDGALDTSLWTISTELFGSMLVFAFLALTLNTRNKGIMLLALLIYFVGFGYFYYAAFLLGIALHFTKHWEIRSAFWRTLLSTVLFLGALVLGAHPAPWGMLPDVFAFPPGPLNQFYHVIGSVMLIVSVLMSPRLQQFFGSRVVRFFGYISFCLYLLHILVIGSLGCYLLLKLYPQLGYTKAVAIALFATAGVTITAAYFMTKLVDERGVRLSRYVYRRWFYRPES